MIDKSKRNFFRRAISPLKSFIYPPYFEKKENFLICIECNDKSCIKACPEKIIQLENDIPIIKFGINGCTFCDECAKACELNVLEIENKKEKLNAEIIINPQKCLAFNQTVCFSCQEICEENVIIFTKGMFNPIIDENCPSCGFCISVCPTNAIEVKII